jgi:hypothetical protein
MTASRLAGANHPGGRSRTGVLEFSRRRPRNVTGYWRVSDRAEGQSEVSEIALHTRSEQWPVTRWKANIHAPKPEAASGIS